MLNKIKNIFKNEQTGAIIAGIATLVGVGLTVATTTKAMAKHEEIKKERVDAEKVIEEVREAMPEEYSETDYTNDLFITQNKYIVKHIIAFFQPAVYSFVTLLSSIIFVKRCLKLNTIIQ